MKPLVSIRDFSRGFTDRFGRGKVPPGFFEDSLNLLPTKEGSLETAHGYAEDVASLPTAFPDVSGNGTYDISKLVADPFAFSSELPSSYDGRVYFFEDSDSVKHVALDKWYKGSTIAQTGNGGFVMLDERKSITGADVTISGASTRKITIANAAATHGFSTSNDFYNGWRVAWLEDGSYSTNGKWYAYVTGYSFNAGTDTATFTVLENLGSSYNAWTAYAGATDTLVFQRWFHRPQSMQPTFDTVPGQCFEANSRVRGCGGASSSQHKFPWISQYINRVFFANEAEAVTYQGTYVDEMECSPFTEELTSAFITNLSYGHNGSGGEDFTENDSFEFATTLVYDGYEESPLSDWASAGAAPATQDYVTFDMVLNFARLNKRVTDINLYARRTPAGTNVVSQAYFVKTINITSTASTAWNWNDTSGGFKLTALAGQPNSMYQSEWANRGSTYYSRTGRLEEDSSSVRHIVAWKYTEAVAGRRFFANFYDPNEATVITDFVRFTPIEQSGASNFDVIPYERDSYEVEAASGDPSTVQGLLNDNGWLVVFKDNSIFSWYIGPNPESWVSNTVSLRDGLYSPLSLVRLPDGAIGFADVDDFKILKNQRVVPITHWIHDTYFALTKSSIKAWYDKIDGSLRFVDGADSTNRRVYVCYPQREGFPWYKIQHPTGEYVEFVVTLRDGSVVFSNQLLTKTYKWAYNAYVYGAGYIRPYMKTAIVVLDEQMKFAIDKIVVTKSGNASAGTLLNNLYLDGTTVTVGGSSPWLNEDKTKTSLYQKLPATANRRMGRRIQFAYNTSASGEYCTTARMQLDDISVFGVPVEPANKSV